MTEGSMGAGSRQIGFNTVDQASSGEELLEKIALFPPKAAFVSSTLPDLSATDFTTQIRHGFKSVNRTLGIIAVTSSLAPSSFHELHKAGVNEILVRPFSASHLQKSLDSIFSRPRQFIDVASYRGPCRRRKTSEGYNGQLRRSADNGRNHTGSAWEAESDRALVGLCVENISTQIAELSESDRRMLREIYSAVRDAPPPFDEDRDSWLAASARSLSRYIVGVRGTKVLDHEVIATHLSAMHSLCLMKEDLGGQRQKLVEGLFAVVDKRLGVA
jgi:two-component system, chemotaxis family, chemotaxis protein CheY